MKAENETKAENESSVKNETKSEHTSEQRNLKCAFLIRVRNVNTPQQLIHCFNFWRCLCNSTDYKDSREDYAVCFRIRSLASVLDACPAILQR